MDGGTRRPKLLRKSSRLATFCIPGKSTIVVQRLRSNYVGSQTEDDSTPGEPTNDEPLTLRFGKHGFLPSKYASSLNVWDGEPLHGYYDG